MYEVFTGIIDYAGIFPPATLSMSEAVASYSEYRQGPDRSVLGRFVVSESRLPELVETASGSGMGAGWSLAVVMAPGSDTLAGRLRSAMTLAATGKMTIAAVEVPVAGNAEVVEVAASIPDGIECYAEVPHTVDPEPIAELAAAAGIGIKIRTGGVVPGAFPASEVIARFIAAAVRHRVPYKATAGLHHPVRGDYRLTYEVGSALHSMNGFVNLLGATAALIDGDGPGALSIIDTDGSLVSAADGTVRFGALAIKDHDLAEARRLFRGFGSCSFREPVDELRETGIT